jgi:crotonobetainyl-CoA:carnitine CoA-transferase CaiB-like acyl-CoA transferase
VKYLRFPVELSTGRAVMRRPPPAAGEHAEEILRECGYGAAEIAALRVSGTV